MFDYKIFLFIIPLVIILFFAYREISNLKQNIADINTELKQQSTTIASNVNQCVDRIEKISKIHITELQNINKINSQRINKISCICPESDNETEGLSRNYISPVDDASPEKEQSNAHIGGVADVPPENNELYMSESIKLPVYDPNDPLVMKHEDMSESRQDQETETDDEQNNSDDEDNMVMLEDIPTFQNVSAPMPQINCGNMFDTVVRLVAMNDVTNTMQCSGSPKHSPIIERLSEQKDEHRSVLSSKSGSSPSVSSCSEQSSVCSDASHETDTTQSSVSAKSIKSNASKKSVKSHASENSVKSNASKKSVKSSVSENYVKSNVSAKSVKSHASEKSINSNVSKNSVKSNVSKKSVKSNTSVKLDIPQETQPVPVEAPMPVAVVDTQKQDDGTVVPKSLDEYTLVDLKNLAKTHNVPIMAKVDGKLKQYKKAELYFMLKEIKK